MKMILLSLLLFSASAAADTVIVVESCQHVPSHVLTYSEGNGSIHYLENMTPAQVTALLIVIQRMKNGGADVVGIPLPKLLGGKCA